jgi:hypothetical protein
MKNEVQNRLRVSGIVPEGCHLPVSFPSEAVGCIVLSETKRTEPGLYFTMEIVTETRPNIDAILKQIVEHGIEVSLHVLNPSNGSVIRREVEFY